MDNIQKRYKPFCRGFNSRIIKCTTIKQWPNIDHPSKSDKEINQTHGVVFQFLKLGMENWLSRRKKLLLLKIVQLVDIIQRCWFH
jgi:hypothetical protein